jgi:spore maturation protein CgeB
MKLVIFGLTISSSWGNGHATIWRGLCRALSRRGARIVFFERDVPYYSAHRDLSELPGGELELYSTWEAVWSRAQRQLADADVAIVSSYCPDGVAASELVLGSRALRIFYDLDTPVTLEHLERGEPLSYIGARGLADFDLVLSYTGGAALDELQRRLGARRVCALYGSVDPALHSPCAPVDDFRADLSYIATYAADRQQALATLFLTPARRSRGRRFLIAGAQYPADFPWMENIFFVRHVPPGAHAALYCSSRLTLNLTRAPMRRMGYCPSGRLFEAAACGTPVISDGWDGLDHFFTPGSEILLAESTEDVLGALALSDETLAAIGSRARARALEEHSAECRARDFEAAIAAANQHSSSEVVQAVAEAARG